MTDNFAKELVETLRDIARDIRLTRELEEEKRADFLDFQSKKQVNKSVVTPYSSLFQEQNKKEPIPDILPYLNLVESMLGMENEHLLQLRDIKESLLSINKKIGNDEDGDE